MVQDDIDSTAIEITIFTDPLCCWSWAFEAQLQQLKFKLGDKAQWHYRMGGLIPSWDNYHDQVNSVSRPMQMGPVWMHAGQIAQQPICHQMWIQDPPASSYPACIAVKCAQLQSAPAGEMMLQLLRHASMSEGRNIARQDIIFEIALQLTVTLPGFKLSNFKADFLGEKGMDAFRNDLSLLAYYRINRFPALIIKVPQLRPIVMPGYRQFEEILKAIEEIKPGATTVGINNMD